MTGDPLLRVSELSKFYGSRVGCENCHLRPVAG